MEGLNDYLLDMAMALVQITNRGQGRNPFGIVFADAQEQAAGKGNLQLPRLLVHPDTHRRVLVGRMKVRHALPA